MAVLLMVESSTEVCSVAISKDGQCLYHIDSVEQNSHTELLTILIDKCLSEVSIHFNAIDAIAIRRGPGSYTSLRIGAGTVKGICYALSRPLITIDSLSILAEGVAMNHISFEDVIIPMIDARRMEIYTAVFNSSYFMIEPIEPIILDSFSFSAYQKSAPKIHLCGNGMGKYHQHYPNDRHVLHHNKTSASFMTRLSHLAYSNKMFADVAYFTPDYVKSPNITSSKKTMF